MEQQVTKLPQAFENTSTNVAAAQMRNALTNLAETVEDPKQKKVVFNLSLHPRVTALC